MTKFLTSPRVIVTMAASAVLVVWMAAVAGDRGPQAAVSSPPQRPLPPDPLVVEIREHAARLRLHLAADPNLQAPARNPFRFAESKIETTRRQGPPPETQPSAPAAPAPVSLPELTLAGIAEDASPNGPIRTAVISMGSQIFLARQGDQIGGRYRIVKIGAEVVEILDTVSSATFSLALR